MGIPPLKKTAIANMVSVWPVEHSGSGMASGHGQQVRLGWSHSGRGFFSSRNLQKSKETEQAGKFQVRDKGWDVAALKVMPRKVSVFAGIYFCDSCARTIMGKPARTMGSWPVNWELIMAFIPDYEK